MYTGLNSLVPIYPITGMLRCERRLTPEQLVDLNHAFVGLYCAIFHHMHSVKIADDRGELNYFMHELRGDVLVLRRFPY